MVFVGIKLPSNGLLFIGIGLIVGAIGVGVIGRSMPSVSLPGAMIRAMLAAYRRTLKKTMDGARSMDQVVAEAGLPWLETPDQAVVWGTALGLHDEIEPSSTGAWTTSARLGSPPAPSGSRPGTARAGGGGGRRRLRRGWPGGGGIFSSSAVPNLGGMMAALGTIGNSPSSSGSGGFGGGGGGRWRGRLGGRLLGPDAIRRATVRPRPRSRVRAATSRSTSSGPLWSALETRMMRRGGSGDAAAGTGHG